MTDVYYSISPFGTGDIQTGAGNIEITSGVATLSVAQTGNIGVGCAIEYNSLVCYISAVNSSTSFDVITATGGTPADQSLTAVTSIHHVWASLSAAEAAYLGASFLNTTDLVTATTNVYLACYYDHDDQTADDPFYFVGVTANSTYYVTVFTPQGGSESINNQRHTGKWDSNKYIVESNTDTVALAQDDYLKIDGLQISRTGSTSSYDYAAYSTATNHGSITNSIVKTAGNTAIRGFSPDNCVVYNTAGTPTARGVYGCTSIEYCTIYGFDRGIYASSADVKNCIVFGNNTDFYSINSAAYCASDDGDGTNAVTLGTYSSIFTDYSNGDFSLLNFTGTGAVIEQGDPITGITTDIIGTTRDASSPDIGAFEYVASGGDNFLKTIEDNIGSTDSAFYLVGYNRLFINTVGLTDNISRVSDYSRTNPENLGITDNEIKSISFIRSVSDSLGVTDLVLSLIIFIKLISDSVGLTDNISRVSDYSRTNPENLGITDNEIKSISFIRSVSDSLGVTDLVLSLIILIKLISDSVGLTDNISRISDYSRTKSENLGLTDNISRVSDYSRTNPENLGITDNEIKSISFIKSISDSLGITDAISTVIDVIVDIVGKIYKIIFGDPVTTISIDGDPVTTISIDGDPVTTISISSFDSSDVDI